MEEVSMTNMGHLFNIAKECDISFIAIVVRMDGFPKDEVIINVNENIDSKLAYYQKTYDENLNHKFAPGIRIVDVIVGNSFSDIEKYLKSSVRLNIF